MSEKRPKKALESLKICAMCTDSPKPRTGRILGYVAQNPIPRAPTPPATPHFLWFPPLQIAQRTPRPLYHCPLGYSQLQAQAQTGGCQNGSTGSTGGKKMAIFKVAPRPRGMPKQVVSAHFEPMVTRFCPPKMPKCLENGRFWGRKRVKKGSKTLFPKMILVHLGSTNK